MKKILIPLLNGYEETELISTINCFKRNEIEYYIWSIEGFDLVKSSHEAFVYSNSTFPIEEQFDGLFFVGGPSVEKLMNYDEIIHLVQKYNEDKKIIGAICAAPLVLEKAGILKNRKYTCYEGLLEGENNTQNNVEVFENIVTGKNFKHTIAFAEEIIKLLQSK